MLAPYPCRGGDTEISQGWGWWKGGGFRISVFQEEERLLMENVHVKECGSDGKKYEHKDMHHFSFLINFEMQVDSEPRLSIMFIQHPRKTCRSPELSLPEYVNILWQQ